MSLRRLACVMLGLATAAVLAACQPRSAMNDRADQPIPSDVLALMSSKGMSPRDPVLMRIFKEQSRLEVWKKRPVDGKYALLKSYQICRWSGDLGPKIKTGDRQAPEGFYTITPALMNPNSHYYLSFNTGYPNAFDRSYGRTGSDLMVHGDCLSAGCFAMTDKQMAEIYAIAREAFRGGQREFQLEIFPFPMTPTNMAERRNSKYFAFWKNLKTGYDHFEVTREEPKVAVCDRKYVFDATPAPGTRFEPDAPCPAYSVAPRIAAAVNAKERADAQEFAKLVREGTPIAAAYIPQDGRLRRTLNEPIHMDRFGNVPTMTAAATPTAGGTAAHAPALPAPSPTPAVTAFAAPSTPPHPGGGLFAWLGVGAPATSHPAPAPAPQAAPAAASVPMPVPNPVRHGRRTAYAADR